MSGSGKRDDASGAPDKAKKLTEPVDVIDGVPDRSVSPRPWKYVALAVVLLIWVGLLVLCGVIGML